MSCKNLQIKLDSKNLLTFSLLITMTLAMSHYIDKLFVYLLFFVVFMGFLIKSKGRYVKNKIDFYNFIFIFSMLIVTVYASSIISGVYLLFITCLMYIFHQRVAIKESYIFSYLIMLIVFCGYPLFNIDDRLMGLVGNVNSNALVCFFAIFLALMTFDLTQKKIYLVLATFFYFLIFLTVSRSMIIISSLYLIMYFSRIDVGKMRVILILLMSTFAFYIYINNSFIFPSDLTVSGRSLNSGSREGIYNYAFNMFLDGIVTGVGESGKEFIHFGVGSSHSTLLRMLIEGGVLLAIAYILLIFSCSVGAKTRNQRIFIVLSYVYLLGVNSIPYGLSLVSSFWLFAYYINILPKKTRIPIKNL